VASLSFKAATPASSAGIDDFHLSSEWLGGRIKSGHDTCISSFEKIQGAS
jgi:hypothetical protein